MRLLFAIHSFKIGSMRGQIKNGSVPYLSLTHCVAGVTTRLCTWQQKCRFSHGGGANSTLSPSTSTSSSLSAPNANDLKVVNVEKSVQVEFPFELPSSSGNTCAAPMQSSSLPSRPSFTADLQPVLVGAALSYDIVDSVIDQCAMRTKTSPRMQAKI